MPSKAQKQKPIYTDPKKSFEERAEDLLSRMTLKEKINNMFHRSEAVPRLGIETYHWWNECLHGVETTDFATVFPQSIALAASFDRDLIRDVFTCVSDEARAFFHHVKQKKDSEKLYGLTYWAPNINIFRDPRWGRGQETYGEDPYLAGELACEFIAGVQGNDPKYLKLVATPKHYAVHSGPEKDRHWFNARVSLKQMWETYLPAFEKAIVKGGAYSIMSAYNRTNGESCTAHKYLLEDILRKKWQFSGFTVSDCGAVKDIYIHHKIVKTPEEAAALAIKRGLDLNCGADHKGMVYKDYLQIAINKGLLTEEELDTSLKRLLTARFKLGLFDSPEMVPYANISADVIESKKHRKTALTAAQKSMVLLKNDNNLLPLNKNELKTVAVIGPSAEDVFVLRGNYSGCSEKMITLSDGIKEKLKGHAEVKILKGCNFTKKDKSHFQEAIELAKNSDAVILTLGYTPLLEGEESNAFAMGEEMSGDDREQIDLPGVQEELMKEIAAVNSKTVLLLTGGSPIAINQAEKEIDAILMTWYSGEEGGTAAADILFGDVNPCAKLPVTFYRSLDDIPPYDDYTMEGRTYRYLTKKPLYPFGHGLSYTRFVYSGLSAARGNYRCGDTVSVSVNLKNCGGQDGEEITQLYITDKEASCQVPIRTLAGFKRTFLKKGEEKTVRFDIDPLSFAVVTEDGQRMIEPGTFELNAGGRQPDERDTKDADKRSYDNVVTLTITFTGENVFLDKD